MSRPNVNLQFDQSILGLPYFQNFSWVMLEKLSFAVGLQVFNLSQPENGSDGCRLCRLCRLSLFLIAMRPRRRHSATYKVQSRSIIKNHCMLSRSEFFKGSSEKFLHELSTMLEVDLFLPGQDIIQQGSCGIAQRYPQSLELHRASLAQFIIVIPVAGMVSSQLWQL